jgi:hypothetical protein
VVCLAKENDFQGAMNDMGTPKEMSPVKDITGTESDAPILEVNRPVETQDMLEIRNSF